MYFVDFFKNLFKKNNIGTIIWFVLNILLISAVFGGTVFAMDGGTSSIFIGIAIGLLTYGLSIMLALSNFGERILRILNRCKPIDNPEIARRLQPIFDEVYARAKKNNPELPDDIQLYLNNDSDPNAFACGRRTVCVTRGLLSYTDDDIRGVLGHEFGHLAHKDTDLLQIIFVGNLIVNVIFFLIKVFAKVLIFFWRVIIQITIGIVTRSLAANIITWFTGAVTKVLIDGLLAILMAVWTKLGVYICMASSRANEYLADRYSFELGYGYCLKNALQKFPKSSAFSKDVFAILRSSHPDMGDRIDRLNALLLGK